MNCRLSVAAVLLSILAEASSVHALAQQVAPPSTDTSLSAPQTTATSPGLKSDTQAPQGQKAKPVRGRDQRRAAKLYLKATTLFEQSQFEEALDDFQQAAALDPNNTDYALSAQVARSHSVTALIQSATKARTLGDSAKARADLQRARDLDPQNPQIAEHLFELSDDAARTRAHGLYEDAVDDAAEAPRLLPTQEVQSFHIRSDRRQVIQRVFKSFGIQASIDQSVSANLTRFDIDSATFEPTIQALSLVTDSFYVPIDAHRVLVARNTPANRQLYLRQEVETVYLPGFSPAEMAEVSKIAKDVFATPTVDIEQNAGSVTVRAPVKTLDALNATLQNLVGGRSEVMLDVRIIQLAHTAGRNTGVQLPQQVTAFNVYTEEEAILNANQALVQQIISSGLAAPGDTLAILGILLASGQVSNSIFTNGIALFGGGLTLSGLSPGATTLQLNFNSSDSRALDDVQLHLEDGRDETLRSGSRYPIMVASYSGLATNGVNIPGLTTAGSSSGLSSLLSSISGATTQIPQIQYQDVGLTLKTTPKVMRSGDVALTMDLKITSLTGTSANGIPVMTNREYSGVITLKSGVGAVLMSELSSQESRALSGTPGLTEIPGLSNVTDKNLQSDYATLLIVLTPHLISGPQNSGHGPMIRVDNNSQLH